MSTKISNTLFRFVTMRTPELLEKEEVNKAFVKHPESEKDATATFESKFLAEAAKSTSDYKSLVTVAKGFEPTAIKKRENLVDATNIVSKEFYDFAIWLTSNRSTLKVDDVNKKIVALSKTVSLKPIGNATATAKLWENLFYQIITYKSNYVREAILSILVADFFLKNYGSNAVTDDAYRKLAQARVIIPNLFMNKLATKTQVPTTSNTLAIQKSQEELAKQHQAIMAANQAEEIKALIQEVKNAENLYTKKTQQAYNAAFKQYELAKEAAIEQAQAAAQNQASSTTTSTKEGTITDATISTTPTDSTPEVVMPIIKPFKFERPLEIDLKVLQSQLSPLAFEQVQNFNQNMSLDTFGEMIQNLQEQVEVLQQTAVTATAPQEEVLVNVGGLFLPAAPVQPTQKVFTIINTNPSSGAVNSLNLLFNNSFDNQAIASANYELTFDNATKFTGTSFQNAIGNKNSITIFLEKINLPQAKTFAIKGTFVLADGRKVEFEGKGYIDYKFNMFLGTLLYILQGQGTYTLSELPTTGDFIPPMYGVKRLGIADYRKVEQEICCYVPGEVSHIENIMASEYKDRTTRALQRREETNTFSKETETEKLTDTTTSNRFEMNQEVNNLLAESSSNNSHIGGDVRYSPIKDMQIGVNASADFATNTTKEESNHQAVTNAKEVTERALDRIVQKVKEERIVKITNEFEETNTHGFDNRKNPNHISGVYRWVDKVYRNTVVNYGKRLMYEFMVPEPAAFHNLAATISTGSGEKLVKPVDPKALENNALTIKSINDIDWTKASYWATLLNANVEKLPDQVIYHSIAFHESNLGLTGDDGSGLRPGGHHFDLNLPEKYYATYISGNIGAVKGFFTGGRAGGTAEFIIAGQKNRIDLPQTGSDGALKSIPINIDLTAIKISDKINLSLVCWDIKAFSGNLIIKCELRPEVYKEWQIKTFNAIMAAYEQKLADYNQKLKQLRSEIKGTNPGFYRQIENTVLRKNCIEYLNSHNLTGINPGKELITGTNAVPDFKVKYDTPELEAYAARVKFFEQAFEWNNISYNFYPMYWGEKAKLQQKYNVDEYNDPIFRAFLQSGMARVIVTVRPGFEEAVNWYITTGQIWNGGQVPTIDDPLYISIVDELREIDGDVEETWETRVPTSLTILQAGSAGLDVKHALLCDEDCKENTLFDSDGNAIGKENPFVLRPIEIITPVRPIGDATNAELSK